MTAGELEQRLRAMEDESNHLMRSNIPRHTQVAEKMMQMAEGGGPVAWALACRVMGNNLRIRGELPAALKHLQQSARCWRQAGDEVEWARTQTGLLPVLVWLGKPNQAVRAAQGGLAVFLRAGQSLPAARLLSNAAIAYSHMGKLRAALRALARGEELAADAGDLDLRARINHNRSLVLQQLGQHAESFAVCVSVVRHVLRANQPVFLAQSLQSAAMALFNLGRYGKALRRFARARALFATESVARDVAVCDLYICACYIQLNRHDQALSRLRTILDNQTLDQAGFQYAAARLYEGMALARQGRTTEASVSLVEAARWFEQKDYSPWAGRTVLEQAELALAQGQFRDAIRLAGRAGRLLTAANMPAEAAQASMVEAEAALLSGQVVRAEGLLEAIYPRFKRAKVPGHRFRCLRLAGQAALQRGELDKARRRLTQAVRLAEQMRATVHLSFRKAFLDDKAGAYADLVWVYLKQGKVSAARQLADRAKSRSLVDMLAGLPQPTSARSSPDDQRLLTEIAALRRQYQEMIAPLQLGPEENLVMRGGAVSEFDQRSRVEQRLAALWDEWELRQTASLGGPSTAEVTGKHASGRLPAGTCTVEYFLARRRILAFVTDRSGVKGWVDLGDQGPVRRVMELLQLNLDASLRAYGGTVPPGVDRNARALLRTLFDQLWAPLRHLVEGRSQAVIIPHGMLHLVPFEALTDGQTFLVEGMELSQAPSRAVWERCRERTVGSGGASHLVMGFNPDGSLPFVEAEAMQVAAALQTEPRIGEAADSAALASEAGRTVVHLAVHGEFRPDNPHFSTLLLADGPFTASDAASLRLDAALLVLSGCETGVSRVTSADELLGLISAFLCAGSASILASRWRVEDGMTADLMDAFYRGLLANEGKAGALRRAQRLMIVQGVHPLWWGAFGLIGDSGPLAYPLS